MKITKICNNDGCDNADTKNIEGKKNYFFFSVVIFFFQMKRRGSIIDNKTSIVLQNIKIDQEENAE